MVGFDHCLTVLQKNIIYFCCSRGSNLIKNEDRKSFPTVYKLMGVGLFLIILLMFKSRFEIYEAEAKGVESSFSSSFMMSLSIVKSKYNKNGDLAQSFPTLYKMIGLRLI